MAGLPKFQQYARQLLLSLTGIKQTVKDNRVALKSVTEAVDELLKKAAAAGVELDGHQKVDGKALDSLVDEWADLVADCLSLESEIENLTERLDRARQPLESALATCRGIVKLGTKTDAEVAGAVSSMPCDMREAMERYHDEPVYTHDATSRELTKARADAEKRAEEAEELRQELARTVKTSTDEVQALRDHAKKLSLQKEQLKAQVAGLEEDVEAQQERIGRLEGEASRDKTASGASLDELPAELDDKEMETTLLEAEVTRLEGVVDDANEDAQVERLEAELSDRDAQIKELQDKMEQLKTTIETCQDDAAVHVDERASWDELEKKLNEEARRHGEERDEALRRAEAARTERDDAVKVLLRKRKQLDQERAEVLALRTAAAKQDLQLSKVTGRTIALEARVRDLESAASSDEARLETALSAVDRLRRHAEDVETERSRLQDKVAELRGALADAEAEAQSQGHEAARLALDVEQLEGELEVTSADNAAFERSSADLRERLDESDARLQQAVDEKERFVDLAGNLQESLGTLRTGLAESGAEVARLEHSLAEQQRLLEASAAALAACNDERLRQQTTASRFAREMARARARASGLRRVRAMERSCHRRHARSLVEARARGEGLAEALQRSASAKFGAVCQDVLGVSECSTDWLSFTVILDAVQELAVQPADGDVIQWRVECPASPDSGVLQLLGSDRLDLATGALRAAADSTHAVDHSRVLLLMNHVNRALARAERAPGKALVQVLQDLGRRLTHERPDIPTSAVMLAELHTLALLAHRFAVEGALALLDTVRQDAHCQPPVALLLPLLAVVSRQEWDAFAADCSPRGCLFENHIVLAPGKDCLCVADVAALRIYALPRTVATWVALDQVSIAGLETGTVTLACTSDNLAYLFKHKL
ncbi:hypothetical protein BR93DRAFT_983137 [Coniochaeta sp. PMI_546]|nr:hypothetical protein BR93DRAFT_983137 [Coniochaeta sp. PMI_546]